MADRLTKPKTADTRAPVFTAGELDRMAEVTSEDIADARDAFRSDAPARFRTLLDATPIDTESQS